MRRLLSLVTLGVALSTSIPANATYNATVIGTVYNVTQMSTGLTQYSPETIVFQLTNGTPSVCPSGAYFIISPDSVTDGQTRKNMVAMLFMAKATGATIEVAYDNAGGFCDHGFAGVYFLELMP
jgi:hypothetical protein